jgi:PKD repeat protein
MLKVPSWKNLHGLAGAAALAAVLLFAGAARTAMGQACYQRSAYLMDPCGTSSNGSDYEFYYAAGGYYAFADGTNYLVFCQANDLTIYNVGSPLSPVALASAHIPWDWKTIDVGGDTHGPYKNHIMQVATAGGFHYGLVSMGEYGWDFLRISGGTRGFLGTGYHPVQKLNSAEYQSAALFTIGNATYAAAQKLDQGSITSEDSSIQIYQIGTATDLTPGLSSATMQPLARVPTDASFPTRAGVIGLWVVSFNGSELLFVRSFDLVPGLLIADVTTPSKPRVVNIIRGDAQLFTAPWAVDEGHSMVWVADSSHPVVHAYSIVGDPPTLSYQYDVTWWGTGTETLSFAAVSVAGNLLAVGSGSKMGYLSLAGGQATRLPSAVPFTDLSGRVCLNPNFTESVNRLCTFQVAGQHYVLRSMVASADIVGVNNSCISTTPLPDFIVTGGSASASCAGPGGYTQADRGFPGDTFTIKDQSSGVWDTATLDIKDATGKDAPGWGGQFAITSYGESVPWTPPAGALPGDYYVTLSIAGGDPPFATKVISLCNNPKAVLTVAVAGVNCSNPAAGCTALVNDTVSLGDAGTQGTPSGGPIYLHQLGAGAVTQGNPFQATSAGNYTVGVIVPYGFPGSGDSTCTAYSTFFGSYLPSGSYASCAIGTVQAGYGTASFQVEQPPNNKVADASQSGTVNVAQAVSLKFLGRIATGYTPAFHWSIPGVSSSQLTCGYTASPYTNSTCTIPPNTLSPGSAAPWNLTLDVCSQGGLGSPPAACSGAGDPLTTAVAPAVTVTPTLNSITFTATPSQVNVGQTVFITLGQMVPATGYSSLLIDYGGMSCDGVSQKTIGCILNICTQGSQVATFSYAGAGTKNITITGTLSSGGSVQSAALPITVAASGTCPCPSVTPTISGPSSAQPGQSVAFSATASAGGHGITSWAWTFGDGGTATGQSVSHTWTGTGTYQVHVTATSDCGSSGADTNTIVIGGGGGGNLTITPSPATVDPGAKVTFTFSPAVRQQGDSVTFNFGDGVVQTLSYNASLCGASGCGIISHIYASAGNFTVTGGGTAGGVSVSGSTTVTVQNTCTLPSAPVAAFSWEPTLVRIGQVVQFHDESAGSPTAWSWNFGGPGVAGSSTVQTFAVTPAVTLTITPSNPTPSVGQQVLFAFSPALTQTGDSITFDFGDGSVQPMSYNAGLCGASGCGIISHSYAAAGTYTVTASGTAGGYSVSGSTSVTVGGGGGGGGTLTITPSPANATVGQTVTFTFSPALTQTGDSIAFNFADGSVQPMSYNAGLCGASGCGVISHSYAAAGNYTVTASGTAGGASVSGSTTVVVSAGGGGGGGTSNSQNPTYTYTTAGDYTVTLTATNCKGSSTLQLPIVVLGTCTETGPPVADFTWGPNGTLAGYPEQQQPYAGQQVTFTDNSTNEPDTWHWYDFQEDLVDATVTTPTFTHTWQQPGDKNVRMTAHNCSGQWSAEVLHTVHIYEDKRHVTADFSWSPSEVSTGAQVTFTAAQGFAFGDPTDFTWTFDDGSTQTGASVTYSFKCGGDRTVTLTARRGNYTGTASKPVSVIGQTCGPDSIMTVDAAKVQGLNGTSWRTDVRVFNPADNSSAINLQFLPVGQNNVTPFQAGPYPVNPKATLVLNNILDWIYTTLGKNFQKTALRVTYDNPQDIAPVVMARTYTPGPNGGNYGQFAPGIAVIPGTTPGTIWITGLHNNGLATGFRTNYSLLNLRDSGSGTIGLTLLDASGAALGTASVGLAPFGYLQDSVSKLFGGGFDTVGDFSIKVDVPPGADIQAYGSVVDNLTGDPSLIPAVAPANSPIFLPAIAHLAGEVGTVWRTDLMLTNPDMSGAHTWEVRYTPKQSGASVVARTVNLAPGASLSVNDLVSWIYGGMLADDAQTSGIVRVGMGGGDGSGVYPIVAARSYNLTPNGTFGQNIVPMWAARGVSITSANKNLLITGMSSEDIARTNLGFVNLSDTDGVNFSVLFYDESGYLLNPADEFRNPMPLNLYLPPGSWDQDKLENRFQRAFKVDLRANERAISAVITVVGGGPGLAYATVIDSQTGDPNFIPAEAAP